MKPRPWHNWVVVLAIVALGAVGVFALWGDDLAGWIARATR